MVMFFSSIQPSLLSSCRNASKRTAIPEAVLLSRKPMRGIFPVCASAGKLSGKNIALSARTIIFLIMSFSLSIHLSLFTRHSHLTLAGPPSLDHFIRPREKFWRECQTDLLRCFQVDHELKLRCLLHRQISRFGTFQDLVDVNSRASISVSEVPPVGHETALIGKLLF